MIGSHNTNLNLRYNEIRSLIEIVKSGLSLSVFHSFISFFPSPSVTDAMILGQLHSPTMLGAGVCGKVELVKPESVQSMSLHINQLTCNCSHSLGFEFATGRNNGSIELNSIL